MNLGTWKSNKSLIMQEIRENLKKKPNKGEPSISRKEANRTWREDILGILSEDQKIEAKTKRQQKDKKNKSKDYYSDEES